MRKKNAPEPIFAESANLMEYYDHFAVVGVDVLVHNRSLNSFCFRFIPDQQRKELQFFLFINLISI